MSISAYSTIIILMKCKNNGKGPEELNALQVPHFIYVTFSA